MQRCEEPRPGRDVAVTRGGALQLAVARHLPRLVDRVVARTLGEAHRGRRARRGRHRRGTPSAPQTHLATVGRVIRALPLVLAIASLLAIPASADTGNPWLDQRTFINMAHQGGEDEFPSNTMYAFKESLAAGADTLELDVQPHQGRPVRRHARLEGRSHDERHRLHDRSDPRRDPAARRRLQLHPRRNAVAGRPESEYPLPRRPNGGEAAAGGLHGGGLPRADADRGDGAFPNTPINIEIKGQEDQESEFVRNAELLAELLNGTRPARPDRRVVQPACGRTASTSWRPRSTIAPGLNGLVDYFLNDKPMPNADAVVAIQVPDQVRGPKGADPRARPPGAQGGLGGAHLALGQRGEQSASTTTSSTTASTGSCPRSRWRSRRCCEGATSCARAARARTRAA